MPTATPDTDNSVSTAIVDAAAASADLLKSYQAKQAATVAANAAEANAKTAARQLDLLTKQTKAQNAAMSGGSKALWALPVVAIAAVGLFFFIKKRKR